MTETDYKDGVSITLDGSPVTLRYTLGAAKAVNSQFGNFINARQRVADVDFQAIVYVVAAAIGKSAVEVETSVFGVGALNLVRPLGIYLDYLANGGHKYEPPKDNEETVQGNG